VGTVRVYDLATSFRLTTKEVLERLHAAGVEALTFGSTIDEVRAREVLSQPVARIPAHTIRPGTAAPAKPAARRSARLKPQATETARGTAPKRRPG
jgi:hypothetical protein